MKKFSEWLEERDPELYNETVMGTVRRIWDGAKAGLAGATILGMGLGMADKAHAGEPTQSNKPAVMKVAYGGDGGGGGESLDQLYQKAQKLIEKKSATKPGTDEYRKLAVETEDAINDYLNAKKAQESGGGVKPVGSGGQKAPQPKVDDGQSAKKVQPSEPVAGGEQQKTLDIMSPEFVKYIRQNNIDGNFGTSALRIFNRIANGEIPEKIENFKNANKKAVQMFGDKIVHDYFAAIESTNTTVRDAISKGVSKALKDSGQFVEYGDAEKSLQTLKQNPQIIKDAIDACEEAIRYVIKDVNDKDSIQFMKNYHNYKINLLKQIQQGLASK